MNKNNIFKSYIIKKKFNSKKNKVYLIDLNIDKKSVSCILKKYTYIANKTMETYLLKLLRESGLDVPKIYFVGDDYILLEYLCGDTLLDVITNLENNQGNNIDYNKNYIIIFNLFKWLESFYYTTKNIMGINYIFNDMNFRNFIINDKFYAIDFEDCKSRGSREEDGGKFCAYLLTYNPIFTKWKLSVTRQAVKIMTQEFGYNKELLKIEISRELAEIHNRRNIKIPEDIIERIFNIYS